MDRNKISVIIPCYNAEKFIEETLNSVFAQTECSFEIIAINDGSTDRTEGIIKTYKDSRLRLINQKNSGVSVARNVGLKNSDGDFVIFFDADDLMSAQFLSARVNMLTQENIDFVSGPVSKFVDKTHFENGYRGPSEKGLEEIILYVNNVVTCPSNIMFKKAFLEKSGIKFQEALSSTADRFFLIESFLKGKGRYFESIPPLLYRISRKSMSHSLTQKLVEDNINFYNLLSKKGMFPAKIKNKSLFLGYYILAGASFKTGLYLKAFFFGIKAMCRSPYLFFYKLLKL
jgi:glycosyltransferase involved in cell wall biosynthesis